MAGNGPIRAGLLRHDILIRRAGLIDDGKGGQTRGWGTVAQLRAQVEGMDGREAMIAHALQGTRTWRITIRFRSDIEESDQIRLSNGTDLNITSITDPDGRRIQLQIIATTGSAVADQ